jgi:L,D-peptidoglycan transpeptidase YkuD (ErfK/YbiS/YcfS/YnhG family)
VRIPEAQENEPQNYWPSVERMKRRDHLYELGLIVKHNTEPAIAGKGSAIFFHVWRSLGAPTLGCTAMDKQELNHLLTWLDPDKHPLLIQVPETELGSLLK